MVLLCTIGCLLPSFAAAADEPDTPSFADVWYPLYSGDDVDVDAKEAWERAPKRGEGVTVAVVDQGVWAQHPELAGNVEPGIDYVTDNDCDKLDPPVGAADHGTHIAGLIAAHQDGVFPGMAGLAPGAHVLPLRAIDDCGEGQIADVARAFEDAGLNGIPVVTASFSTDPLIDPVKRAEVEQQFRDAIEPFPNTLYVVAAGNDGADLDEEGLPVYPCSLDADNVICVGATDTRDAPTCWGNVGGTSVDLFAPGVSISSTVRPAAGNPRAFGTNSGTSQSTALVAAAAALVLSDESYTGTTAGDLKEELRRVDTPFGLVPKSLFGGRLSAAKALERSPRPPSFGNGGPGGEWKSCDPDHDHVRGGGDLCPRTVGTISGCPDTDGDGKHDGVDNCVNDANGLQDDLDRDGTGDACDSDLDGDGVLNTADVCPRVAAATADGCPSPPPPPPPPPPTPTPDPGTPNPGSPTPKEEPDPTPAAEPRVTSLNVTVTPKSCKGRESCKQAAKVTVKVSRSATVVLKVERKVGRKWMRVTLKSLKTSISGKSLTVRGARGKTLTRGSYRVTVTISGKTTQKTFKV